MGSSGCVVVAVVGRREGRELLEGAVQHTTSELQGRLGVQV